MGTVAGRVQSDGRPGRAGRGRGGHVGRPTPPPTSGPPATTGSSTTATSGTTSTTVPVAPPVLAVTPARVDLGAAATGATLTVRNGGGEPLSWTAAGRPGSRWPRPATACPKAPPAPGCG